MAWQGCRERKEAVAVNVKRGNTTLSQRVTVPSLVRPRLQVPQHPLDRVLLLRFRAIAVGSSLETPPCRKASSLSMLATSPSIKCRRNKSAII